MDFAALIIGLRAVHILGGVIWAGGTIAVAFFAGPAASASGTYSTARLKAMRTSQKRTAIWTGVSALLAILAGLGLFGELHVGAQGPGEVVLGIGALAAILSFPAGAVIGAPSRRKLSKMLKQLITDNREPRGDEVTEITRARVRVVLAARVTAGFLIVAVICMAIWRYL